MYKYDKQFTSVKVYKFSKIKRLPESLEKDTSQLTAMEKEKIREILQSRKAIFFTDNNGDFYLEKDPVQNDLLGQFWVLSNQLLVSMEDSIK